MSYESISLVEMDDFLRQRRFKPVDLYFRRRPVKEWVYERRLPQNANHFVRVYTTIQRYGGKADQSRDVGKDAIRVQVIYRDEKGETLVSMPKRVNRVSTWRDNLDDRLKEVAELLPKVKMDSRGEPMTLRKKRGNLFWGSRDYPNYKETQRYGAENSQEIKEYISTIHDGYFFWTDRWDDLEFKLQTLPMEIFERYENQDNVDGAWIDSPVNSRRLEDTLNQFRWQGDGYPAVVLELDENGNYDIIDGYHRLNALQILDYDTVEAWVGQAEEKILCGNCNWSWNRSEGGDDVFICHKCGTDTQVFNSESKNSKQGVAVLYPEDSQVSGVVRFQPVTDGLLISYKIKGLTDGKHGFHIHEYGDLTDGCTSACAHFNPDGATHGGLDTKIRHFGDLGNIESKDRLAEGSLFLPDGRLDGSKYSILGRMIIVHADRDDLGKGGDEESLKTGNAGKRLACGVIGLADPKDAVDKKAETEALIGKKGDIAWRAMNPNDYTVGLESGHITSKHEIYAMLGKTPTAFQLAWRGYPLFEIDMEGLKYIKAPNTQWNQPRHTNIVIVQDIPVDKVVPYDSDLGIGKVSPYRAGRGRQGRYMPQVLGRDWNDWTSRFGGIPWPGYGGSYEAEEIRCCKECDKTTGLTTIQAGTYCYDCLPINLGAEDIIYVSPNEGIDIDAKIETIKNTGQKVARIDWFATPKGNGFGRAEFENFRDWAYKQGAAYIVVESVPESVNFWKWMGFIEPFGLVEPKDEFLATHLGLNTLIYLAESEAEGGQFAAEDNYDATYGKKQAKIRRRLKNKIMKQNIMGTAANKWSARKSQELKRQYEKACEKAGLASYKGSKTAKQDDLSNWSKQKWTTASGKKSSVTGEPYFPEKAVAALKKRGLYTKAKRQKQKANKAKKNARYSDDIREVVGQFRAEDINQTPNNTIINILLLEWAMVTNDTYDSLTIQKGLADYIEESPNEFVGHMLEQDLISFATDISSPIVGVPVGQSGPRARVPTTFLKYLQDKDRDHWVNMKSRAISKGRYQMVKEQISEDRFWLSDIHKANYYQWLPKSAINYQNI